MNNIIRHVEPVKPREHGMNHNRGLFKNRRRCIMEFSHAARKTDLFQELVAQVAREINAKRKERRKNRTAKTAEQERNRYHDSHFTENQVNSRQKVERRVGVRHQQNGVVNYRK